MQSVDLTGRALSNRNGRLSEVRRRRLSAPQRRLLGRTEERRRIDLLLSTVREGKSGVLVMRGDPGVGKTALLDACANRATGFRVLRVAGVESEMELPFAALHQLCSPVLDSLDALPEPQHAALGVAFGLSFGHAPDRFRVALAVLSLAAEAARKRPLLCLVDDAQWLDAASAQVLGFVARRLVAESVAMVFAARVRPDADQLANLPEMVIGGLEHADAHLLLRTTVAAPIDPLVRERLIAETRGNPLALVELAAATAAMPLAAAYPLPFPRELSARIERSFLERLKALDESAQRLVLIAAAEPIGDPVLLWRAAERLGITAGDVPAEAGDLLTIGERVTFLHPLVRSAVYRAASPDQRRAVHLALAGVTDPQADSDRRAWHLAAAAEAPDEGAAAELERSADRAQARGGFAAAATFLQRAVALTGDPAQRAARALAAARASLRAGAFDDARGALTAAEAGELDALQRAQVDLLRGQIAFAAGAAKDATALLLRAARQLEALDVALARETYLGTCGAALFAGPACAQDLQTAGRAVRSLPRPSGRARAVDLLLDGLAVLVTEGRGAAADDLLAAARAFGSEDLPATEGLRWGWMATATSNALWDDQGLRAVCERHVRLAREAGALEQLPIYLIAHGAAAAQHGDFPTASALVAEADAVAEATGTRLLPFAAELQIASLRGREAEFFALKLAATDGAELAGQGLSAIVAAWTEAILWNGLGRYAEALEAARRAKAADDVFASMWALPELVEAATRVGAADAAREALACLVETTQAARTDFGLGIEARSRALTVEGPGAEAAHREAVERLSGTRARADEARAHLLFGEWLRREGRRVDARGELRTAYEMLVDMGMDGFAERTRHELLATGATVRKRLTAAREDLTPQEAQIAALARDGLTNAEIAARLFLSPRTIEWHLKKVFTKLGVSRRRELRDVLPRASSGT